VLAPVGFKVVRVETNGGIVHDFAVNRGKENGPASKLKKGGLERPVACRFDPSGRALYVVDFGAMAVVPSAVGPAPRPFPGTGVLWRIVAATPVAPPVPRPTPVVPPVPRPTPPVPGPLPSPLPARQP
jgi:hypothetical protein